MIKTHGTNCAFRREAVAQLGGFDPAIRFFLDETDLNHRIAEAGMGQTAIVPLAQVQHGFAASANRAANRVPKDLSEIGRSTAIFLAHHCPADRRQGALQRMRQAQQNRLEGHRKNGRLGSAEVERLMQTLEAGIAQGQGIAPKALPALPSSQSAFKPFPVGPAPKNHRVIATSLLGYRRGLAEAREAAASGEEVVTVLRLSRSLRRHWSWFDPSGVWLQRGGLWGASDRGDPPFKWWRRRARTAREAARIAAFRAPE